MLVIASRTQEAHWCVSASVISPKGVWLSTRATPLIIFIPVSSLHPLECFMRSSILLSACSWCCEWLQGKSNTSYDNRKEDGFETELETFVRNDNKSLVFVSSFAAAIVSLTSANNAAKSPSRESLLTLISVFVSSDRVCDQWRSCSFSYNKRVLSVFYSSYTSIFHSRMTCRAFYPFIVTEIVIALCIRSYEPFLRLPAYLLLSGNE